MNTTIRTIRWPDKSGVYWVVEHRRGPWAPGQETLKDFGYTPIKSFGSTHQDGVSAVLYGRKLAADRGLPFVSEVGINTEDC